MSEFAYVQELSLKNMGYEKILDLFYCKDVEQAGIEEKKIVIGLVQFEIKVRPGVCGCLSADLESTNVSFLKNALVVSSYNQVCLTLKMLYF